MHCLRRGRYPVKDLERYIRDNTEAELPGETVVYGTSQLINADGTIKYDGGYNVYIGEILRGEPKGRRMIVYADGKVKEVIV